MRAISTRYSDAYDRIIDQLSVLQEVYLSEFYVKINYSNPAIFDSYADTHCNYPDATAKCECGGESCSNSGFTADGILVLSEFHHKNITNIMRRIPTPDTSKTFKIAYIGHDICITLNGEHRTSNGVENPVNGATDEEDGLVVITNITSAASECKTTLHEFGHLYGAIDHYGEATYSTDDVNELYGGGFNEYCIYGEKREEAIVIENMTICEGCKAIIEANIDSRNQG